MECPGGRVTAGFFHPERLVLGEHQLPDSADHARARRLAPGDEVRLTDGAGQLAYGRMTSLSKRGMGVVIDSVEDVPAPTRLDVVVPIADKDRMLLAAEKCVELQITGWHPTLFARSRSVSGRGEGDRFHERVRARMIAALEQSGGAWLPAIHDDRDAAKVWPAFQEVETRLLLDADGRGMSSTAVNGAVALAVGPEGGLEDAEREDARRAGWTSTSLAPTILRFETAVIAGVAIMRALQLSARRG